ncbi:hypothetical protein ABCS02_13090 [Microbacterium sp. X-17]|uniref:hypothetical protein n=1 Tax=Microbacterium sp. X-17 TaxID=3144404 RepID=UPI0031F54E72
MDSIDTPRGDVRGSEAPAPIDPADILLPPTQPIDITGIVTRRLATSSATP